MRYINLQELLLKRDCWRETRELWKNVTLKKDFREFFYDKCWYTEVILAGSDIDIDHFRPKASVKQYKDYHYNEQGYEWLKNEPSNYRGSCAVANRPHGKGGKRNYFPLKANSPLMQEDNPVEEKPLLLDPCKREDVELISYLGGMVTCASHDPDDVTRCRVSGELYNWDDTFIKRERVKVWEEIERTIEEYEAEDDNRLKQFCLRRLRDAVSREAPFSACAISCVKSMAPDEIKQELAADLVL